MVILFTFLSTFHTGIHYLLENVFVHRVYFSAGHSKQIDAYRINLVGSI